MIKRLLVIVQAVLEWYCLIIYFRLTLYQFYYDHLNAFSSSFEQMEALSFLKKYQAVTAGTKSNKHHVALPTDCGIYSKCFYSTLLYLYFRVLFFLFYFCFVSLSLFYLSLSLFFFFCSLCFYLLFFILSLSLIFYLSLSPCLSLTFSLSPVQIVTILLFPLPFLNYYYVLGNRCTHKPNQNKRINPTALLSLLSTQQQDNILKTGLMLPR